MTKPKTPDIDQLKKDWAEISRQIEEITGEKPEAEPQKPVCANCKWRTDNGLLDEPVYWLCTHKELGLAKEIYDPLTGETNSVYQKCTFINKGDCSGFEPLPPKRTWKQWFRWLSGV